MSQRVFKSLRYTGSNNRESSYVYLKHFAHYPHHHVNSIATGLAFNACVGVLSIRCFDHNHSCLNRYHHERRCDLIAYYLFFDISTGVQASLAFSKRFKHQTTILYDGDTYTHYDFDSTGFVIRRLKVTKPDALLRALWAEEHLIALIVAEITKRKKVRWLPYIIRSCNEIARYVTSIDLGLTFNPKHFYKKLLKYDTARNYEILYHKEREIGVSEHGIFWRQR